MERRQEGRLWSSYGNEDEKEDAAPGSRYSLHPTPTRPRLSTLERQNFQHVMCCEKEGKKEGNQSV